MSAAATGSTQGQPWLRKDTQTGQTGECVGEKQEQAGKNKPDMMQMWIVRMAGCQKEQDDQTPEGLSCSPISHTAAVPTVGPLRFLVAVGVCACSLGCSIVTLGCFSIFLRNTQPILSLVQVYIDIYIYIYISISISICWDLQKGVSPGNFFFFHFF